MSIGAGSVSFKRLQVLCPADVKFEWVMNRLKKAVIDTIGLDEAREEAKGWCNPFTGDPELGPASKLSYENAIVFGFRMDHKRIPGTLFRLQLKAAFEDIQKKMPKAEGGAKARLNKKMRESVRDRIKQELLKRTLPNIRLVEVVWHLDSNEMWLFSSAENVNIQFEKLFSETFSLPFAHINAGTMGINFDKALSGANVSLQNLLDMAPVQLLQTASSSPTASRARAVLSEVNVES